MNNRPDYNLMYCIEQVNSYWELTVSLAGLNSFDIGCTGYLNLENTVLCLACPKEQIEKITESFKPYIFMRLSDLNDAVTLLESEKEDIISTYLFNYELKSTFV
jgi:hypothetical protein